MFRMLAKEFYKHNAAGKRATERPIQDHLPKAFRRAKQGGEDCHGKVRDDKYRFPAVSICGLSPEVHREHLSN